MLNQINNINTTLNGEIVKLDERLEKQLTNMEERLTNVEVHQGGKADSIFWPSRFLTKCLTMVRACACGTAARQAENYSII